MRLIRGTKLRFQRLVSIIGMLAISFILAATHASAATPAPETIQATFAQAGNTIGITLTVFNYSTPADMQVLSHAFQQGQDQELAIALSKTKAVGRCVVTGNSGYDVAFIQMVQTPTGRQIIFITNRPHARDQSDPLAPPLLFDLEFGQFDLNDTDPARSTGFLFPASKLVVDEQGSFHYDLAGASWKLVKVLDLNGTSLLAESQGSVAIYTDGGKDQALQSGH